MSNSFKIYNQENRITIGARVYHTSKLTLLEPGDVLVYSLLLSNKYASPSHNRVKSRYNNCDVIIMPVISDTRGTYVDLKESVIDFFETEVLKNKSARFVIPIDILKEYENDYDYDTISKLFVELCNEHDASNVVLPIEWTDHEHYKKIYMYTHMCDNRFTREVVIGDNINQVMRNKHTDGCHDVKIEFLGITYNERAVGWVIV